MDNFHPYSVEQNVSDTLRSVSPAGNLCHFVLLDKDESCPTADLSNIGHSNGPAYSLQLGADTVAARDQVRLLGVTISADLSLDRHVSVVSATSSHSLR